MNITYSKKGHIKSLGGQPVEQFIFNSELTVEQRVFLSVAVIVIVLLSIIGNVATIIVAIKSDKIHSFFRTCLISLASSELLSSVLTGINYQAQFIATFFDFWTLGGFLCHIMPFLITTGVLVNSITLVGISFNRYLGVTQVIKDSWQPTKKFCVFISLVVWGISAGIASPNIAAYQYTEMYIFEYADRNGTAEIYKVIPHRMCSTNRYQNVISFTILVAVLFVPMFLAFLWFNLVLAKDMWNRRKMAKKATQENMTRGGEKSSGGSKNTDGSVNSVSKLVVSKEQSANTEGNGNQQPKTNRNSRHLRIFCVILLLMLTYLCLRLPQWLFLILCYYNVCDKSNGSAIILQFSVGILSMLSAVFNPLLYAFLTQTVDCLLELYHKVRQFSKIFCLNISKALSSVIEQPENTSTSSTPKDAESN